MTSPVSTAAPSQRLESVDLLRGLVMVIMALDHTRDFWSSSPFDPTDLTQTSTAMFCTRWITHLCAPVFMALAGTGAALSLGRGRDRGSLARFLITRGLWLVVLELTVVNFGWKGFANIDLVHYRAMVIWALGWSMVALAGLIYLPRWLLISVGAIMVLGHNALDGVSAESMGHASWLWTILHEFGVLGDWEHGPALLVLYPLVPWIGVMALGYAFGAWISQEPLRSDPRLRQRYYVAIAAAMLVSFVVLRGLDWYGDPAPWSVQPSRVFTVLSFLNVTKYPPSLLYLLVMLGIALLLLAGFEQWRAAATRVLLVFGRVPLFFYILHIMLIGRVAELTYRLQIGHLPYRGSPEEFGFGLVGVYAVWIVAIAALYPVCRWYAGVKARHPGGWLSYL